MPINKINLNGCKGRQMLKRALNGCHRRNLAGYVTVMGKTYDSDDIANPLNYSQDSSGNWYADESGSAWWVTTPEGVSIFTDGQTNFYTYDSNGVGQDEAGFDLKGVLDSIGNITKTGTDIASKILGISKTGTDLAQKWGLISDNSGSQQAQVVSQYPSTNYTPFILGGLGLIALIMILKR